MTITFSVLGVPVPGGSKKGWLIHEPGCPGARRHNRGPCVCKPRVAMMDAAGERNKYWRYTIAQEARKAMQRSLINKPLEGPLKAEFVFMIPRPKMHFNGKGHLLQRFMQAWPIAKIKNPDVLKLGRAAEDALNGVLWGDDSQIVDERLVKVYGETPGVTISVSLVTASSELQEQEIPESEPDHLPF